MYIVTLNGKVMCEGTPDEDCDFHIDHDHPVFHDSSRVHPESVIQLWRFGGIAPLKHLVYVAKLDDEGQLQLVAGKG